MSMNTGAPLRLRDGPKMIFDLQRRTAFEFLGTALLVATVVGSGVMAETLTHDVALQLLCNTLPTGAILVVLITILGPISGAHFNPAVSLAFAMRGELRRREAALYLIAQVAGGIAGAIIAHLMFGMSVVELSAKLRTGSSQWLSEVVAAFGLILVILNGIRFQQDAVPWLVGFVHHCRLLVYGLNLLRESGGCHRTRLYEQLLRNTASRRAGIHRGRTRRRVRGSDTAFLAVRTTSGGDALRILGRWMRMLTIPNQSSVAKAYEELDEAGRMRPSAYYDRLVDVMEELMKFTLLTRGISGYLTSRYSEQKEAQSAEKKVDVRAM